MNSSPDSPTDQLADGKLLHRLPWIAGILAIGLILAYLTIFRALPINERPDAWGQFGDYMGGLLNPFISLFTLIVAVKVWNLQKTEMLETRKALEDQGKTAEQQRREQRFFDLLNLYRSTVDSIVVEQGPRAHIVHNALGISDDRSRSSFSGKRAFSLLTSSAGPFPDTLVDFFAPKNPYNLPSTPPAEDAREAWNEHSPILDHYFRVIFTLLREAEPLLQNDRYRYIKILRAQLSRDEVNLIAMNLLFDEEGKKMRELVADYGFLKHLPSNNLRSVAERELDPRSFGLKWATAHRLTPAQASPC